MSNEADKAMAAAKFEALIETARQAMPEEARKADLIAQVRRIHYDASIRKGFTAEQALVLCMKPEIR